MIKEAYCSFEVSKLLKEKGFNWHTQYVYTLDGTGSTPPKIGNWRAKSNIQKPTQQMAMKWLREEKNIFIVIEPHTYDYVNEKNKSYVCSLWVGDNYYEYIESKDYPSYEDAVEAALRYTLEKLI